MLTTLLRGIHNISAGFGLKIIPMTDKQRDTVAEWSTIFIGSCVPFHKGKYFF